MGPSWVRYVGSSLLAVQAARARAIEKAGVEREAGLDCGMRLFPSTKLGEGGGQQKIRRRIISVGLDRPSKPRDRLVPTAEVDLRNAHEMHPDVSHGIARTEAQGLTNVSLRFVGATDENLTKSDTGMGAGKISIQLQRMFTFGDALCRALGQDFDKSQPHMAKRVVWDRGQGFGQLRFGGGEGRHRIRHTEQVRPQAVRTRRSDERVDIVGIGGERAIEEAARSRHVVGG